MTWTEDDENEARQLNAEERYERNVEGFEPEPCECGTLGPWILTQTTTYGEDADGRRGVPLRVYECSGCGAEREVINA